MIEEFIKNYALPSYRIKQFNLAFYKDFVSSFDEITTWSKELREELKLKIPFSSIVPMKDLESLDHGTHKVLFKRESDNKLFESVLMRHEDGRNTICVSCMIGCPVGCVFCATGRMKTIRNLTTQEIVDQVLYFARILKKSNQKISNIVFMGMGEPLLNLLPVLEAIKIFNDPNYMGIGIRRITISTSGITPKLRELMRRGYKGRLALSLHAPNQALREKIMPIAKNYPLTELLETLAGFANRTQLRVSYEYILIDGVNDTENHALELARLIGSNLTHVNLIPYNPILGVDLKRSSTNQIYRFSNILTKNNISNTFRVTMGDDIKAACGQLATEN